LEKVKANLRAQEEPKSLPSDAFPWLQICQNCFCDRGSAPDPAGGAYSASPDPLAGLKGPTSKGRWREGERKERKGRGREGEGRKGEGEVAPPFSNSWIRPRYRFTNIREKYR